MTENFKNWYGKHKASLSVYKPEGNTTLSTHFWTVKEAGGDPKVEWKILEKNIPTYNPVTKICRLCLREKFNIVLKPHLATLNSRQEIFAHCRHKEPKLIGKPPDWKNSESEHLFIYLIWVWILICIFVILYHFMPVWGSEHILLPWNFK